MKWYQLNQTQLTENSPPQNQDCLSGPTKASCPRKNVLTGEKKTSNLQNFQSFSRFADLCLTRLCGIKGISGDFIDMSIILFVVVINSLIGYLQEAKASDSLKAGDEYFRRHP